MKKCKIENCEKKINSFDLCAKHYKKQYNETNKEKIKAQQKEYDILHKEEIKNRKQKYYINNKKEIDDRQKEYTILNKKIIQERQKQYNKTNKEKINIQQKKYNLSHKEEIKKYHKIYYLENTNKILKATKKYSENNKLKIRTNANRRRKNDIVFRLRRDISGHIRGALKRFGSSKYGSSCLKYLGYSIKELKDHLENQFDPWMNWNNHGSYNTTTWDDNDKFTWIWQIDHIIPQSKLPFISMEDDNFKKCWSLENLRPYSAKQNIIDGNKRMPKVNIESISVTMPMVRLFQSEDEVSSLAAAVNTIIVSKIKIKCETLGTLGGQFVGLFYLQRNHDSQQLHDQFMQLIESEEIAGSDLSFKYGFDNNSYPLFGCNSIQEETKHELCSNIDCDQALLHMKGATHCICGDEWNKDHCWSFDDNNGDKDNEY